MVGAAVDSVSPFSEKRSDMSSTIERARKPAGELKTEVVSVAFFFLLFFGLALTTSFTCFVVGEAGVARVGEGKGDG